VNSSAQCIAPGPHGHWLLGHLLEFRRDVLGLLTESARTFGQVVRFRLGPQVIHLLNHPSHIEHVLQKNHQNYDKNTRSAGYIKSVTGESLLASNGELWKRQRRLLQPAFHRKNIAAFARQMTVATTTMLERWRAHQARKEAVDVASEMMRLTYAIVGRTLFSADVGPDADTIEHAMQVILPHTFGRLGRVVNWPEWFPTPGNRRFRRALRDIDGVVYRIIDQHRRAQDNTQANGDLLSMLLQVRDEETGLGFSDEQLRNETITFLLAGHETTANALTWTFYLLSQHPEVERQLRDEVNGVLGGRPPTIEDLPRLSFTRMVIQEAMRLYPPIWIIERRVIHADTAGGYDLPAGSAVVIAPYVLHRHPNFWEEPDEFKPARFANPIPEAYIPFGAGPRFCIGREFAMLEAQLITAMVAQSFRLCLLPGHRVEPLPGITLRVRDGLLMTLHN
jgi:enediyne biosynthesis protein E7